MLIDTEVKELVHSAYETAKSILEKHRPQLESIAAALLEREILSHDEILKIIAETPSAR
jgi:cell division protease FtsH